MTTSRSVTKIIAFCTICLSLLFMSNQATQAVDNADTASSAIALRNGSYLEVPNTTFEIDDVVTVELWFRVASITATRTLFIHEGSFNSYYGFDLRHTANGSYAQFVLRDSNLDLAIARSSAGVVPFDDGRWHHIAGVRDGAEIRLYIDGALIDSSPTDDVGDLNANKSLKIGYWFWHGATDFEIDEVRVWDMVRTEAEISGNRFGSVAVDTPGLTAYWPLNEATGTTFADETGNGNNGVFVLEGARWIGRAWTGGTDSFQAPVTGGLGMTNSNFIIEDGDDFTAIPSAAEFGTTTDSVPASVLNRWQQEWFVTAEDLAASDPTGTFEVTFDIFEAGSSSGFDPDISYSLLLRPLTGGIYSVATVDSEQVNEDQVTFTVDSSLFTPTMQRMTLGYAAPSSHIFLPLVLR